MLPVIPDLKDSIVDVLCVDISGRTFVVEMQMFWTSYFKQRILFNAAKMYVTQIERGENYDALMPVYGLNLVNDIFDNASKDYYHRYTMCEPSNPEIKLNGKFSVADDKVVCFSKGNLQATTADNGTTWTWAFAANQLTFVGNATANTAINGNGTVSANGTVDLFGWSTATTKYGINNSRSNSIYSGDFVDWGSNPDLIASLGKGWRTLTGAEWTYLLSGRTNATNLWGMATINVDASTSVHGLVLLPDTWTAISTVPFAPRGSVNANQLSLSQWETMEANGAVFLPAAGNRNGTTLVSTGANGNYWTATNDGSNKAYYMGFASATVSANRSGNRYSGRAVRLVQDAN